MTDRPEGNPSKNAEELDEVLATLDEDRRTFVKQLATASAFAVPLTLAATLDGSPVREAHAQSASSAASSAFVISTPATLALMGTGVAVLAYMRKRGLHRRAKQQENGE